MELNFADKYTRPFSVKGISIAHGRAEIYRFLLTGREIQVVLARNFLVTRKGLDKISTQPRVYGRRETLAFYLSFA